jgi:hypothetical protein
MNMHDTAHEIMHRVKIVTPLGYRSPSDQIEADRQRAKFIFEQQGNLMKRCGFNSAEELVQNYWTDPYGQLPRDSNEA